MRTHRLSRLIQAGFTLIELIIVIVIIGIMAAVAIPQYNDLTTEARQGVLKGVAGSIASAAATNYALRSGGLTGAGAITTCTLAFGLSSVPAGVAMTAGALSATAGSTAPCTLTHTAGGSHTFDVISSP